MITNERQYKITRSEAEKFHEALRQFNPLDAIKNGIDPVIADAQKRALETQLEELENSLDRYETLQAGQVEALEAKRLDEIGNCLIEARIARRMTQKDLAERLGMKAQQVQRYEQESYTSANLPRLLEVADALEVKVHFVLELTDHSAASGGTRQSRPSMPRLPVRAMKKRGWLSEMKVRDGDEIHDDIDLAALFVQRNTPAQPLRTLHKQSIRLNGQYDEGSLLAWKARILHLARNANPSGNGMEAADPVFLKELAGLSRLDDGPLRAVDKLQEVGVTVVIERHLEKTHLDGAAMLLDNKHPVVGLTLRHDRLDNFWFVLFHELGHVTRHRNTGLADGFFDDETASLVDDLEQEADDFARNALIPDEIWTSSFVRYSSEADAIRKFAERLGIHPAIVAGRIRRERETYTILSNLVGRGMLRKMLNREAGIPGGYDEV